MSFSASVALVLEQIDTIPVLRRSHRAKRLAFAVDLCLVAHGVRSGYLVDALFPPHPFQTFTALLEGLHDKSPAFDGVACRHHAPTTQSFYVHVSLLRERLAGPRECVFVQLDRELSASREPPDRLQEVLRGLGISLDESPDVPSRSLPDELTEETLVPLAALMIDYPVAYIPAFSGQTSFLEGEALDVYMVSFNGMSTSDPPLGLGQEHVLLKFSCPRVLVHDHPELSPAKVIERLRAKFTPRFERIGARATITHHTETMDRVAL